MRKDSILIERGKRLNLLTLRSQICKLSSKQSPWKMDEKSIQTHLKFSPHPLPTGRHGVRGVNCQKKILRFKV
jgi:hypothetical protein